MPSIIPNLYGISMLKRLENVSLAISWRLIDLPFHQINSTLSAPGRYADHRGSRGIGEIADSTVLACFCLLLSNYFLDFNNKPY